MSTYFVLACTRCQVFTHLVGFSAGGGWVQGDLNQRLPEFMIEHIGHEEDLRVLSEYDDPCEKYTPWVMPSDDEVAVNRTWIATIRGWLKR